MASHQGTVDFILDQMAGAGAVSARKMFGEYGLYCNGRMFALVCDDQLFIKPTTAGRAFAGMIEEGAPYPNARPHLLIGDDRLGKTEWLEQLVRLTVSELPEPKPKAVQKRQ